MKRILPIFKGVLVISASISIFFFHQNILVQIFYIAVLLLIIIPEVILRYLFMVLAWYVYTNYSADNKMKWVGLSMVAFNIITMFFDSNYHKSKK
jgi:hypothetical protein